MKRLLALCFILSLVAFLGAGCSAAKNTGEAVGEGVEEGAEATAEGVEEGAEAVGEAAQETGEVLTDASITAAIKMKFANDDTVSASNIDVDTNEGRVTLTGIVRSQAEADRALQLARETDGVKMVENNLRVVQ